MRVSEHELSQTGSGDGIDWDQLIPVFQKFHGHPSPGLLMGAQLVRLVQSEIPQGILYDAVCETSKCLPDAVQLLTPCTIGNGWLKVIDSSRFALTLYNKYSKEGVRGYISEKKIEPFKEISEWFFKKISKKEQNLEHLLNQIKLAGSTPFGVQKVQVIPECVTASEEETPPRICRRCGEAYRMGTDSMCPSCVKGAYYQAMNHTGKNDTQTDIP